MSWGARERTGRAGRWRALSYAVLLGSSLSGAGASMLFSPSSSRSCSCVRAWAASCRCCSGTGHAGRQVTPPVERWRARGGQPGGHQFRPCQSPAQDGMVMDGAYRADGPTAGFSLWETGGGRRACPECGSPVSTSGLMLLSRRAVDGSPMKSPHDTYTESAAAGSVHGSTGSAPTPSGVISAPCLSHGAQSSPAIGVGAIGIMALSVATLSLGLGLGPEGRVHRWCRSAGSWRSVLAALLGMLVEVAVHRDAVGPGAATSDRDGGDRPRPCRLCADDPGAGAGRLQRALDIVPVQQSLSVIHRIASSTRQRSSRNAMQALVEACGNKGARPVDRGSPSLSFRAPRSQRRRRRRRARSTPGRFVYPLRYGAVLSASGLVLSAGYPGGSPPPWPLSAVHGWSDG